MNPNYKNIAFSGWRNFHDYDLLDKVIKDHIEKFGMFDTVHVGDAKGLDELVRNWASHHSIEYNVYYADWKKLGSSAGPIRNKKMLENAEFLIAFPNEEHGIGTQNTMKQAEDKNMPCKIIWI